jgi:hypothetical protein
LWGLAAGIEAGKVSTPEVEYAVHVVRQNAIAFREPSYDTLFAPDKPPFEP